MLPIQIETAQRSYAMMVISFVRGIPAAFVRVLSSLVGTDVQVKFHEAKTAGLSPEQKMKADEGFFNRMPDRARIRQLL
jgi:hypothetical protein